MRGSKVKFRWNMGRVTVMLISLPQRMGDDRREDNLTFHFNSQILTLASGQTNLKLKFKIIQPHFFFSYLAEREETLMEALGYMHNCFRFFF